MIVLSRKDAVSLGKKQYFTGLPCPKGHVAFRFVSNCACSKCAIDWRSKNKDKSRKISRNWYARNADRERSRAVKKRWDNIDGYRAYAKEYNGKNLDRLAAIARNRRSRAKNSGGKHTASDVFSIFEMQQGKCACCRIDLTLRKSHVDHIMPIARGGRNDRRNLQVLCQSCNQHKSAKDPIAFMQSQGRLL